MFSCHPFYLKSGRTEADTHAAMWLSAGAWGLGVLPAPAESTLFSAASCSLPLPDALAAGAPLLINHICKCPPATIGCSKWRRAQAAVQCCLPENHGHVLLCVAGGGFGMAGGSPPGAAALGNPLNAMWPYGGFNPAAAPAVAPPGGLGAAAAATAAAAAVAAEPFRVLTTCSWEQSDTMVKVYVPLRGVQTDMLRAVFTPTSLEVVTFLDLGLHACLPTVTTPYPDMHCCCKEAVLTGQEGTDMQH